MAFDTFPCNPYPISKGMLEKGNNDELNTRVTALEGDVSDLNDTKANQITIAPFFSAEASYEVGDLVYYNGLTYRCTNDHEGEWDADDFASTTIAVELDTLKSGLTNKRGVSVFNDVVTIAEFDGVSSYGAYLTSAYSTLQTYINNLPDGTLIHIDRMDFDNVAINNPSSRLGSKTTTVGSILFASFVAFDIVSGHLVVRKIDAINKTYEIIDNGVYNDFTSYVPAAGGIIDVVVTLYASLS